MAAAFCAAVELYRSLFIYMHSVAHLLGTPTRYNVVQCNSPHSTYIYTKLCFEWHSWKYVFVLEQCNTVYVIYSEVFLFLSFSIYKHCTTKQIKKQKKALLASYKQN